MDFLYDYGLFFSKALTLFIIVILFIAILANLKAKLANRDEGELDIEHLNARLDNIQDALYQTILDKPAAKQYEKDRKKQEKEKTKSQKRDAAKSKDPHIQHSPNDHKKRLFVLEFDGDIRASEVDLLREAITAVLLIATPQDEVMINLESAGGMVHSYGLAASQLQRIRTQKIPLTVVVDRVAASGGYMMACVADKILAAPFAVIGSVGVISQLPNFHKLLKKHDIEYEQHTAGEFKRTLTVFGENTKEAREKFKDELEETHDLFKEFIRINRPVVDVESIATGEHWYGMPAKEKLLIDEISTSDDYLLSQRDSADIYKVSYTLKKPLGEKLQEYIELQLTRLGIRWS